MARYRKRRRLKKSVKKFLRFTFILFILALVGTITYKTLLKNVSIKKIYLEENTLHVKISSKFNKNVYCLLTEEDKAPSTSANDWKKMNNNKECIFEFDKDHYNLYVKKDNEIIYDNKKSKILEFSIDDDNKYYAVNNTYNIKYNYKYIGNNQKINWTSSDSKIVSVNNGKIKTISDGSVTITASYDTGEKEFEIVSTSLLANKPKEYDLKKKYLPCDKYTKEENEKLDEILDYRVHQVGYKTRAAVVEAARFLTLEFPYRINYFYENGRLTQANKIDGEGRYYHVGLYLNSSKYKDIKKSTSNPKIWGCSLYDNPVKRDVDNGLDCSGFVSWAMLNAGFNVGDLGAGVSNVKNLSESLGDFKNSTLALTKKLKVGDFLHSNKAGGHIGVIVGIDEKYFYVAQALWFDEVGVIITKATPSELVSEFPHFVFMDKYYKEDGKLTNMWY